MPTLAEVQAARSRDLRSSSSAWGEWLRGVGQGQTGAGQGVNSFDAWLARGRQPLGNASSLPTLADTQAGRSMDIRQSNPDWNEWLAGPGQGQVGAGQGVNSFDAWIGRDRQPPPTAAVAATPTTPAVPPTPSTSFDALVGTGSEAVKFSLGDPQRAARETLRSAGYNRSFSSPILDFVERRLAGAAQSFLVNQILGQGSSGDLEGAPFQGFLSNFLSSGQLPTTTYRQDALSRSRQLLGGDLSQAAGAFPSGNQEAVKQLYAYLGGDPAAQFGLTMQATPNLAPQLVGAALNLFQREYLPQYETDRGGINKSFLDYLYGGSG